MTAFDQQLNEPLKSRKDIWVRRKIIGQKRPEELSAKERTRREWSWMLYDVGNSAFSVAISTAAFPAFIGIIANSEAQMRLGWFNSISSIILALISPILGTLAEFRGYKKKMFTFFALFGILTTMLLAVIPANLWYTICLAYVLTNVCYNASIIFYDAFLVDSVVKERMDMISSYGFAWGYITSIIPFGISLAIIYMLGMSNPLGYQICFLITGAWWLIFTIPMLIDVQQVYWSPKPEHALLHSFKEIYQTFKDISKYKVAFIFLVAYFFYIDGVDTIISMVVPYVQSVLGQDVVNTALLLVILLGTQIVAFPFAILYGWLTKFFTPIRLIQVAMLPYLFTVCTGMFMSNVWHLLIMSTLIASSQGGIQALSRSYFAQVIPSEKNNEFFGFYNVFGRFAAIMGPALMSLIGWLTGKPRLTILAVVPLFIIGFVITLFLPKEMPSELKAN